MDYKTKMKSNKIKIKKAKEKLQEIKDEHKSDRRKKINRVIRNFVKDWKSNLNLQKYFFDWKIQRKLQKQIHEYVKLCGKPKW